MRIVFVPDDELERNSKIRREGAGQVKLGIDIRRRDFVVFAVSHLRQLGTERQPL